jgi:type II secretory pathway pseudopilin PulG
MEKKRGQAGFTFTEVLFVAVISVVIIATVITAWGTTQKVWTVERRRTRSRIELMEALETIKKDVRLSSATYMSFYPKTPVSGAFTAVSMPVADTDTSGYLSLNSQGDIEWDRTVIYHMVEGATGTRSLVRTVIDPRDNSLDQDERYTQLETAVKSGLGGTGISNESDFLDDAELFEIRSLPVIIDFYEDSTDAVRAGKQVFGWVRVGAGDHEIGFTVEGKHSDSSGYAFGIDNLRIEPCGSEREAEYYDSSFAPTGSIDSSGDSINRIHGSMWDNDNYLEYDATGVGDYIILEDYYDLVRESSFEDSIKDNTVLSGERLRLKLELPEDRSAGKEVITWFAYNQTASSSQSGTDEEFPGGYPATVRNIVKGNMIDVSADLIRIKFVASSRNPLIIEDVYFTERDSDEDGYDNLSSTGHTIEEYHRNQKLLFRDLYDMDGDGSTSDIVDYAFIPAGGEVWSVWTAFPLRAPSPSGSTSRDYLITFFVPDLASPPTRGNGDQWPTGWSFDNTLSDMDTKAWVSSLSSDSFYSLSTADYSTSELISAAEEPVWTSAPYTTSYDGGVVYVSSEVDTWSASGSVESDIYDTGKTSPAYNRVKWSESAPSGTEVMMKVRSSGSQYMDGATDWDLITGSASNPASLSLSNVRFFQFKAEMATTPFWQSPNDSKTYADYIDDGNWTDSSGEYFVTGVYSTWIDNVEIDWPGDDRICLISGYIARKNDYGQVKLTVDGQDLIKTLDVRLGVSSVDLAGEHKVEYNSSAVEPRNTGR